MPSSAVQRCSSPCSSGRSATSIRGLGLDAAHLAEAPPDRVDRVRTPRADPARRRDRGRTASRSAAAAPASRPRGASTARARSRRARRCARARAAAGARDGSGTRSCRARSRPRPRLRRRARPLRRRRARTACRTAPPCPAASAARTCAACRNGGECTLTRSTSGRADDTRDRGVVARRDDVDDLAAVGRVERGRDDARAEAGADAPRPSLPHHLRRVVAHRRDGTAQRRVRERPDAEREQHRADPDVTAEQESDHEHAALERRAHRPRADSPRAVIAVIRPSRGPGPSPAPM